MLLPGRHANTSDYRYGFQGQELDNEIKGEGNSFNYRFRMHDPRVGRFFAVDPLFKEYSYNSPYAFSENRVIDSKELEGLETYHYTLDLIGGVPELTLNRVNDDRTARLVKQQFNKHYITYKGQVYAFVGPDERDRKNSVRIYPFVNGPKYLPLFIQNPELAISSGAVLTSEGFKADWYSYNLQSQVLETAGANVTFGLRGNGPRVSGNAQVGTSTRKNYRKTFFEGNPDLEGEALVIHHAVEQQVRRRYPNLFSESQINSLKNLRGIPVDLNNTLHLGIIRKLWDSFYNANPQATMEQVLKYASKIDGDYGHLFNPAIKTATEGLKGSIGGFNYGRGLILLQGLEVREEVIEENQDNNCGDDEDCGG